MKSVKIWIAVMIGVTVGLITAGAAVFVKYQNWSGQTKQYQLQKIGPQTLSSWEGVRCGDYFFTLDLADGVNTAFQYQGEEPPAVNMYTRDHYDVPVIDETITSPIVEVTSEEQLTSTRITIRLPRRLYEESKQCLPQLPTSLPVLQTSSRETALFDSGLSRTREEP